MRLNCRAFPSKMTEVTVRTHHEPLWRRFTEPFSRPAPNQQGRPRAACFAPGTKTGTQVRGDIYVGAAGRPARAKQQSIPEVRRSTPRPHPYRPPRLKAHQFPLSKDPYTDRPGACIPFPAIALL